MKNAICPCGSARYTTVFSGTYRRMGDDSYDFEVAECCVCGLRRTMPPPSDVVYKSGQAHSSEREVGAAPWSAPILDAIKTRVPGGRLLDVGCNVGDLVALALEAGFDAQGIDLDPRAIAAGRQAGRPVQVGSLDSQSGTFDAVVMNHVLEHVVDLPRLLSSLQRALGETGLAFIYVPNYTGLLPRIMGDSWIGWLPMEHVWQFSPASFRRSVETLSSLRVVELATNGVIEPPSQGVKGVLKRAVAVLSTATGQGDEIAAVLATPLAGSA